MIQPRLSKHQIPWNKSNQIYVKSLQNYIALLSKIESNLINGEIKYVHRFKIQIYKCIQFPNLLITTAIIVQ